MTSRNSFDRAIDLRVLSGGDQPRAILPGEHERDQAMPWIGRAGVTEQFPAHMRHSLIPSQEAHVNLSEPHRAGR